MIVKAIGFLIGLLGVTLLFWLGLVYDRLPAGWPNYQVALPLGIHWTFHAPWAGAVTAANAKYDQLVDQEHQAARHAHQVAVAQAAVTAAVSAHQDAVQAQIRWRTQVLYKEIHDAVSPASDRAFPLSVGWVRWHDAAARGVDLSVIARPAGQADDSASSVKPSDALAAIGANYGACRADDAELADWQAWYARVRLAK